MTGKNMIGHRTIPAAYLRAVLLLTFCCVFLTAGCGGEPAVRRVAVKGKVFVDGKPLAKGTIWFFPDEPQSIAAGGGQIAEDGSFELLANGQQGVHGVPLGRYKVTVYYRLAKNHDLFPMKYSSRDETPLSVEVTEDPPPGAYDFTLTKEPASGKE